MIKEILKNKELAEGAVFFNKRRHRRLVEKISEKYIWFRSVINGKIARLRKRKVENFASWAVGREPKEE